MRPRATHHPESVLPNRDRSAIFPWGAPRYARHSVDSHAAELWRQITSPGVRMASSTMNEATKPNPALAPLSVLIGTWHTVGTHPLVPGKTFHGRTSFA